jgi:hypothetical protein
VDAGVLVDVDVSAAIGPCTFDTDGLSFSCATGGFALPASVVSQADAGAVAVFTTGAFSIREGVVVDAIGGRGLIIDARGAVAINGELRASGVHRRADGGAAVASGSLPSGPGLGRSGAAFCGGPSKVDVGSATVKYGTPTLSPLLGGSAGFGGSSALAFGGGAIQIASSASITVASTGLVDVNGMGSDKGPEFDGYVFSGAGSGGAILLEAPVVTVSGGLAANGGGRFDGGTSLGVAQAPGCDDGTGAGAGSVGDNPNAATSIGESCPGGGGAGWIAIRARACAITGVMSPSARSGCANVLPLPVR